MADSNDALDDRGFMKRTCFVVMPFGEKIDPAELTAHAVGKRSVGAAKVDIVAGAQVSFIDFDRIYEIIIAEAVKRAATSVGHEIECIRSDKAGRSGFIHLEMLEHVVGADIAIVDITTQNANVFYELGVRHSFRHSTTILVKRRGTHIPFNIAGMRVFEYSDDETKDERGKTPLSDSVELLTEIIVASFTQKDNDSLVHNLLQNVSIVCQSWPIMEQRYVWYDVLDRTGKPIQCQDAGHRMQTKSVGFITGDILDIKEIDVWVNPENTKMQMARYHDGSISSNIRYYGAERNHGGQVVEDTISNALRTRMGNVGNVEPGVVVATGPGQLKARNKVKMILHVAALQGEPGKGYQPVRDYPGCVRRVLAEVDRLNAQPPASSKRTGWSRREPVDGEELHGLACTSVILPLFGSRSAGQHPRTVAEKLYEAAVVFYEQNPTTMIDSVYFLAFTKQDQELCERALGLLQGNNRIAKSGRSGQTQSKDAGRSDT
jgi:hypothetical protein